MRHRLTGLNPLLLHEMPSHNRAGLVCIPNRLIYRAIITSGIPPQTFRASPTQIHRHDVQFLNGFYQLTEWYINIDSPISLDQWEMVGQVGFGVINSGKFKVRAVCRRLN